jgi:predicted site-specific integrase-resolvase
MVKAVQEKTMFTLDDLAAQGAGSRKTLRRLVDEGVLPVVYISDRVMRVTEEDWQAHIARNRTIGGKAAAA